MNIQRLKGVVPLVAALLIASCGGDGHSDGGRTKARTTATYLPAGPQVDVVEADVITNGGWRVCYSDLYDASTTNVGKVLNECGGDRLMLACRPAGTADFTVLAQAPRADVIFDTGSNDNTTIHNANGTDWYFSRDWSWGFAAEGDGVNKNSCDTDNSGANDQRLCWHTNNKKLTGGYRCGATEDLNGSTNWERVVLHAN